MKRKELVYKIKTELQYNKLPDGLFNPSASDEELERIIDCLKKTPRNKCLIRGAEYDRIMSNAIKKISESAETSIRA